MGSNGSITHLRDPEAAATAARLRYVSDEEPGYSRRRQGRGFSYFDEAGEHITDERVRRRIEELVIPPAWQDVWICRSDNGHIQATGRDEAGRKQYIYHPKWREVRDRAKFEHLVGFGEVLPALRRRLRRDLENDALDKRKVTAAIIRLMDLTLVRVGNRSYAVENKSYGLTTLRDKHVQVSGPEIGLSFNGKSGMRHEISLRNEQLARIVRDCQEIPGYHLFQYFDENGERNEIDSSDINEYLHDVTGQDITAKDFRTWGGTVRTAETLYELGGARTKTEAKRKLVSAVKNVASALGNTAAVCRQSYIHPVVLTCYQEDRFLPVYEAALGRVRDSRPKELKLHEGATLEFLSEVIEDEA